MKPCSQQPGPSTTPRYTLYSSQSTSPLIDHPLSSLANNSSRSNIFTCPLHFVLVIRYSPYLQRQLSRSLTLRASSRLSRDLYSPNHCLPSNQAIPYVSLSNTYGSFTMAVSMDDLISTMKTSAHVGQGSDLRELQVRDLSTNLLVKKPINRS